MCWLCGGCILVLGYPNNLGLGRVALNPKIGGGGVMCWLYTFFRLSDHPRPLSGFFYPQKM
jgi:hypothetical protein